MNILTMNFVQVLFILVNIGLSQPTRAEENTVTLVPNLDALFDSDGNDESSRDTEKNGVCDTDACRIIAKEFQRGMNRSVSPCDNFYDFMCGAWNDESQIPGYSPMWSRFHIYQDTVNRRIKGILETEPESTDILPVRQAKKWYRACMDVDHLNQRGIKPLESILLQVGGWPMTLDPEEWDEKEHTWKTVEHGYFHITGSHAFYKIRIAPWDGSSIQMKKRPIPLSDMFPPGFRNYTGDDYESYLELIAGVTYMFVEHNKAAVTEEMIKKDVEDLVEFEKELHMIADHRTTEKSNNESYHHGTIDEFVEWYDEMIAKEGLGDDAIKIDFESLIRRKFDLVNHQINGSNNVMIDDKMYFVELTKLLNRVSTRTIVNYLHWYFVSGMLTYTTELVRDTFFILMKNEFDVKERSPRWLECINEMKMRTAAAYAFVEKYFSQEVEEHALEMIENVRQEMNVQIDGSDWLDEESKILTKEKLNAMKIYLGFPDWYKNRTSVLNSYKGLTIGYEHFDNVLSFKKYEVKKSLRYSDEGERDEDMIEGDTAILVNAFYNPYANSVVLTAALFQPPLFTSRVPPSVNYGIIGLAAGHEMSHGFDDSGIQFGPGGNETKLSEDMLELYYERAKCFIDQYDEYYNTTASEDTDEPTRGGLTISDNVADSQGLQAAFKAYKKLISDGSVENLKLPGFEEFNDHQMFFISFAATWCEAVTPKFSEKLRDMDSHSPGRLRVIGPLSNMDDFAEAFNCPKESAMAPEKKCNIWK